MRKDSRRLKVLDAFRDHVETIGVAPTCAELGAKTAMSAVGAWKHVQTLIGEGKIVQHPDGSLDLPGRIDLSFVPTERLRGELARRGLTLDALEEPKPLIHYGRSCAANHCRNPVRRGQLMCRQHWFQVPPAYRSDIMNAWAGRHTQAFQEALERARDHLGGFSRVVVRVD